MTIIAIANCARGVGKTTLAVHLALWFGRRGRPAGSVRPPIFWGRRFAWAVALVV
jgi:hypothetical protein